MVLQRTAKSCGSDAPMLASSLREEAQATVSNKPGHRGEREVSRKTIARGMPGETGVTVVTMLVCFVLFRTRGCGCIERPAFPAPSIIEGHRLAKLGRIAPRECGGASGIQRHCERREAIHLAAQRKNGLLRRGAPRNDGLKTLYVLAV